jgi:hypothetical protein
MEQMIELMLAKMDSFQEKIGVNQEKMKSSEEMKSRMSAVFFGMDIHQAKIEANHEELMVIMQAG